MRKTIPKPCTGFSVSIAVTACSLLLSTSALAQTPEQSASDSNRDAHWSVAAYNNSPEQKNPTLSAGAFSVQTTAGEIKEETLRQYLLGKTLYLRSGFQDNNLEFDEYGRLTSKSSQGSFTLSQIQINKVKLSKHKLELQGDRYGLHFLGAAPYEDPTKATDRVKITTKKKTVHISFDREQVEKPKKEKHKHNKHAKDPESEPSSEETISASASQPSDPQPPEVDHLPAKGDKDVTRTTSPAHASQLLLTALDRVLSIGIDERMISAMPEFWRLYYQAAAAKTKIRSTSPDVLAQSTVDQKARLVSVIDPPSNEFAQSSGIAGMALYHAVIGTDGKVQEVIAGRPIGFGLDENAEKTIRNATFQPALKDGKPVPVALDLIVSFRIYSKRTSQPAMLEAEDKPASPALPGLYTLQAAETRVQQP